eukprot:COSAG02_NODE_17592_length_993_cov_0.908277_2_plen_231_part_00
MNGGASVVGGADIADRLGIHHGSIRVASADLDLHGTASVSQSVRIAGYGMSATGQVSIRAGGMAVGLDGVSAAGGVQISGMADVYSPVTISDSFIVSRGVVLAAGDLLVSSGGVEIRCGASSLNTHATVAQGATLGSRVEIGGALNALQGAAVQGGVRVANDGVNVNSGLSIHGGFSTAVGHGCPSCQDRHASVRSEACSKCAFVVYNAEAATSDGHVACCNSSTTINSN